MLHVDFSLLLLKIIQDFHKERFNELHTTHIHWSMWMYDFMYGWFYQRHKDTHYLDFLSPVYAGKLVKV